MNNLSSSSLKQTRGVKIVYNILKFGKKIFILTLQGNE